MDFQNCVNSFFGPHKSIKFVIDGDQVDVACCPAQYLSALPYQQSLSQFVNSAVQSHHSKFHQGTSTLMAFIWLFHTTIRETVNKGVDTEDIIENLKTYLELSITFLKNKSFNLNLSIKKANANFAKNRLEHNSTQISLQMVNTKLKVSKILLASRHFVTPSEDVTNDIENEQLLGSMEKVVKQISHGQDEVVPLIVRAWFNQVEWNRKRDNSNHDFDEKTIHVLSSLGNYSASIVVPGIVFPVSPDVISAITNGTTQWKTLLIAGCLTSDHKHRGYNQSVCRKLVVSAKELMSNSEQNGNWISSVVKKLEKEKINLVIVESSADSKLIELCLSRSIVILEHFGTMLATLSAAIGIAIETYISDYDASNITRGISLRVTTMDSVKSGKVFLQLMVDSCIQTIVLYSSCLPLASVREHRTWHSIHRLSSCLKEGAVEGGGQSEQMCVNWLKANYKSPIYLNNVFLDYVKLVERNCSFENVDQVIQKDSLASKIEAWRSALIVASIIATTDVIISIGIDETRLRIQNTRVNEL